MGVYNKPLKKIDYSTLCQGGRIRHCGSLESCKDNCCPQGLLGSNPGLGVFIIGFNIKNYYYDKFKKSESDF